LKKQICATFDGLSIKHIQEIIKDKSNKKLAAADDAKLLSSLNFENDDCLTIILHRAWMDDDDKTESKTGEVENARTFEVEKILAHKCLSNKKNARERYVFLVKWKGYDDSNNTFEPVCNLEHCSAFHEYILKKNKKKENENLMSFIPKKYL
jgi:hypothetical protein